MQPQIVQESFIIVPKGKHYEDDAGCRRVCQQWIMETAQALAAETETKNRRVDANVLKEIADFIDSHPGATYEEISRQTRVNSDTLRQNPKVRAIVNSERGSGKADAQDRYSE